MPTLVFTELKPGTFRRKEKVNTINIWKSRLTLGGIAYEDLKQPSSLTIEVDPSNHAIRLTNSGPFAVSKSKSVSSVALRGMDEGLYEPVGDGVYRWAVKER